jgi:hypothetical protein
LFFLVIRLREGRRMAMLPLPYGVEKKHPGTIRISVGVVVRRVDYCSTYPLYPDLPALCNWPAFGSRLALPTMRIHAHPIRLAITVGIEGSACYSNVVGESIDEKNPRFAIGWKPLTKTTD